MAARGILSQLVDLVKAVTSAARSTPPSSSSRPTSRTSPSPSSSSPSSPTAPRPPRRRSSSPASAERRHGPGRGVTDAEGASRTSAAADAVTPTYAPERDGEPDPGEVVWAWVPYEEDAARGKDRPVLVLSVDERAGEVVALMLTSKDHVGAGSRDSADELRHGRRWMDVGTGAWDAQGRPSEVRLDRVLRLPADAVRREGAALDRGVFARVSAAASELHGWPSQ